MFTYEVTATGLGAGFARYPINFEMVSNSDNPQHIRRKAIHMISTKGFGSGKFRDLKIREKDNEQRTT